MYTMQYDITIGDYRLGMLDEVEVHSSVELLSDTATIRLPASEYNKALEVERSLRRGDKVTIRLGYAEVGLVQEFEGYLLRIATDGGSITLHCEDDLYLYRKPLTDRVHKQISLRRLLEEVTREVGIEHRIDCSYSWSYDKFVIHTATAFDVLKKVQEECGADIYIKAGTLHIHPPGRYVGSPCHYALALNVESEDLIYRTARDKKLQVVVKALLPDGKVREVEIGTAGGDKVEVKCPTSDEASMRSRGEAELRRRTYDGYEGSITTWLIPVCRAGDSATIRDEDYPHKDGTYFVSSVKTTMSASGGKREVQLGYRLS